MIKKFNKKITYNIVLNEWLKERKNKIKESSYLKYYNIITNNIKPTLGNISFKKISNNDLLLFFNRGEIIELSDSTKTIILIVIKSSIEYGIKQKYRKHFEPIDIKIQKPKSKIVYFTRKEIKFNKLI